MYNHNIRHTYYTISAVFHTHRRGFNVSAQLEDALVKLNITKPQGNTLFEHFFFPKGHMLKKGDFIERENFAELLDIVSVHGADGE